MKLYELQASQQPRVTEVRCNMCDRAIEKDAFGYLFDHISLEKHWGYHSPYDGEGHKLDICTDCYGSWIRDFRIPPERLEQVMQM